MATYYLKRFSRPEILRTLSSEHLEKLLLPHAEYFASQGVLLPVAGKRQGWDFVALSECLASPKGNAPRALFDALYYIDELSTSAGMDLLLEMAQAAQLPLRIDRLTPADMAVEVWSLSPALLEAAHARLATCRGRTLEYFQPAAKPPALPEWLGSQWLRNLDLDLEEGFQARHRGRHVSILICDAPDEIQFLVRHGGTHKREATCEESGVGSVFYRPAIYDVVKFVPMVERWMELRGFVTTRVETSNDADLAVLAVAWGQSPAYPNSPSPGRQRLDRSTN